MDWNDPAQRGELIRRVGIDEYNRRHDEHRAESVIETVAGHALRRMGSRFGPLIAVGATGNAYKSLDDARRYAASYPVLSAQSQAMIQSGL